MLLAFNEDLHINYFLVLLQYIIASFIDPIFFLSSP